MIAVRCLCQQRGILFSIRRTPAAIARVLRICGVVELLDAVVRD